MFCGNFIFNHFPYALFYFILVADHDLEEPCCCDPHGNIHSRRPVTKSLRIITGTDVEKNPKLGEVLGKHWCDHCRKGNLGDTSRKRLKPDSAEPDHAFTDHQSKYNYYGTTGSRLAQKILKL